MNLTEALDLFDVIDIQTVTKEELKKVYRKLLKKYHPDSNNGDDTQAKNIILAYDIIVSALDEIESYKKMLKAMQANSHIVTSIIPLHKLIEIYKGNSIELGSGDEKVVIDKNNLMKHNIFIMIDYSVSIINGGTQHYTKICKIEMMRNYQLDCDIMVKELEPIKIKIDVLDESRQFNMNMSSIQVPILLDSDIKLVIDIRKKILTGDQNG